MATEYILNLHRNALDFLKSRRLIISLGQALYFGCKKYFLIENCIEIVRERF